VWKFRIDGGELMLPSSSRSSSLACQIWLSGTATVTIWTAAPTLAGPYWAAMGTTSPALGIRVIVSVRLSKPPLATPRKNVTFFAMIPSLKKKAAGARSPLKEPHAPRLRFPNAWTPTVFANSRPPDYKGRS